MAGRRLVVGFVGAVLLIPAVARAQAQPYSSEAMRARMAEQVQQEAPVAPVGPGPAVLDPRLLKEVQPQYTSEAMRAKIQGQVQLEVVILKDGTVGDVRVVRSLDSVNGLDAEAVRAAKQWLFQPALLRATKQPIDYRATIEMSFRIFKDPFREAMQEGTPGLVAPKAVTSVQPEYTAEAKAAGIQGKVLVEVVVNADGVVTASRLKRSIDPAVNVIEINRRALLTTGAAPTSLEDAAVQAAKKWTFEPATMKGQPVAAVATIEFVFALK